VTAGAGARGRKGVCVEGFANACRKGGEGIACCRDERVVACRRGGEGVQRREEVVASPVRVELRRS
jgi:hypothetical protein